MENSTSMQGQKLERDRSLDSGWDNSGWDPEEQLRKNQKAMELLKAMIQRHQNYKTTAQDLEFWQSVYETIDSQRPVGQKLFSEE